MKKIYMKPEQRVVVLQQKHQLLAGTAGTTVTSVENNAEIIYDGKGGSGSARSRQSGGEWDDFDI